MITPESIPVIILAAGEGARMEPLKAVYSKPLLPVLDYPIISWQVRALCLAGFEEFHVVARPEDEQAMADAIAQGSTLAANEGASPSVRFLQYVQERPTGIVDAMRIPLEWAGITTPFLVVLGDIWFKPRKTGFKNMVAKFNSREAAAVIAVRKETDRAAIKENFLVQATSTDRITAVREKPKRIPKGAQLKGIGVYLFGSEVADRVRNRRFEDITALIAELIRRKRPVYAAYPVLDDVNVNTPRHYWLANLRAKSEKNFVSASAEVSDTVELSDCVLMRESRILGSGKLRNCVVMPFSEYELNSAIVKDAILSQGGVVEID